MIRLAAISAICASVLLMAHREPEVNCSDPMVVSSLDLLEDCADKAVAQDGHYRQELNHCQNVFGKAMVCAAEFNRGQLAASSAPTIESQVKVLRYDDWLKSEDHNKETWTPEDSPERK